MEDLAQIHFLCRRGLKELDLIFQAYLEKHLNSASEQELKLLINLLKMDDQSLLDFIINTPKDALEKQLCVKLRLR